MFPLKNIPKLQNEILGIKLQTKKLRANIENICFIVSE